jgi:hypothetical protein
MRVRCGGFGDVRDKIETWSFDLTSKKWNVLECTGEPGTIPLAHAAAILDDAMYIMGGAGPQSSQLNTIVLRIPGKSTFSVVLKVLILKHTDRRWFKLGDTDRAPAARFSLAGACIGTRIFTFGGGNVGGLSEEHSIHILDASE